jgi:glycosyltransferase involved in cell wall biosynthesis
VRVVQLIAPGPAGGAESALRSLALGLREAGDDVDVLTLTQDLAGAHPIVETLRRDGTRVTDLRLGRRRYLAEANEVARNLRNQGADVIHSHMYHADSVAYLARRGVPNVSTIHGITGTGWRNTAYIAMGFWLLRRCDAVICVAENLRERAIAEGIQPSRVHLIPNGYHPVHGMTREEARAQLGLPLDAPVVGWIGRLTEEKGADVLVDVLSHRAMAGVTGVVIGDGAERERVEAMARGRLPVGAMRFTGRLADAARYLRAFDALVLTSRTEGTPMVLLEAMAANVPIVSFRVGGVPNVIDPLSSLLVAERDVDGFAMAIRSVLDLPRTAAERAAAARRRFERDFSATACAQRVREVYRSVMRRRPRPLGPVTAPFVPRYVGPATAS